MNIGLPLGPRSIAALALVLGLAATHWAAYKRGGVAVQAKWQAEQLQASAAALEATKTNAARQVRQIDNVLEATNAQATQAQRLRTDADRARAESERLRNAIAATRSSGVPAPAACPANAATAALGELLAASGQQLAAMAAAADAHALDAATCQRAWPRE